MTSRNLLTLTGGGRTAIKRWVLPRVGKRGYPYVLAVAKARAIRSGALSEPEIALLRPALMPDEMAIDVGAHYGLYAYHLSRAVQGSGRVYCFEPVPSTFRILVNVARLLRIRGVELVNAGCGTECRSTTLRLGVLPGGVPITQSAHVSSRENDRPGSNNPWEPEMATQFRSTIEVPARLVRLDASVSKAQRVGLIKCDVEGFELSVFQGAEDLIRRDRPTIICEIYPWNLAGFGVSPDDIRSFFEDIGYSMYEFGHRLVPVPRSEVRPKNYVFIHPDRIPRFAAWM